MPALSSYATLAIAIGLSVASVCFFSFGFIKTAAEGGHVKAEHLHGVSRLSAGFDFVPSLDAQPPRRNLVATVLKYSTSSSNSDNCLGAQLKAYTFLHQNPTAIKETDDSEFAVLVTSNDLADDSACIASLQQLGARIIQVPLVPVPNTGLRNDLKILQLWALEDIFDRILFVNQTLNFFTSSPLPLLRKTIFDGGLNFGACPNAKSSGISSDLVLFKPSKHIYYELVDLAIGSSSSSNNTSVTNILDAYFDSPILLSVSYNQQLQASQIPEQDRTETVGFNHNFLDERLDKSAGAKQIFSLFANQMRNLRKHQQDNAISPIVPIVPDSIENLDAVMTSRTRSHRIAVLPFGSGSEEAHQSRVEFANHYSQAVLVNSSFSSVLELFGYLGTALLHEFELVWVVDSNLILKINTALPIHVAVDKIMDEETSVVAFKDCENGKLTGSFFASREAQVAISYLHMRSRDTTPHISNAELWNSLLRLIGPKAFQLQQAQTGLYKVQNNRNCPDYLPVSEAPKHSNPPKNPQIIFNSTLESFSAPKMSLVLKANLTAANDTKLPSLRFNISTAGCPKPKLALIGIMTMPKPLNMVRQELLRRIYYNESSGFIREIDFKFVHGQANPDDRDSREGLLLQQLLHPNDTVILPNRENMNDGKNFDWWTAARNLAYTRHPTNKSGICPKYEYIGKTDDDTLIHLKRLQAFLQSLPPSDDPSYIGTQQIRGGDYMSGGLHLLSTSLVEYITVNDREWCNANKKGHEDMKTGHFVDHAGVNLRRVSTRRIHDHIDAPNWTRAPATNQSISLHYMKDLHYMYDIYKELYIDSEGLDLKGALLRYSNSQKYNISEAGWKIVMDKVKALDVEWRGMIEPEWEAIQVVLKEQGDKN
ncbi:hypothetical protein BDR26DRAFT_922439 [Obelidium mucronatum]|nr:hypothetical protein BDR26DRAFT_922439 [Obelidium mucronatum]